MSNKQHHNIFELTLRLSQALDQNYDVVNMDAVISVISILEGTTITKEQLEATRLAKFINQLRRRTNSEHLARRAKSLLKKWREMVGMQQHVGDTNVTTLSTPHVVISATASSDNATSVASSNFQHLEQHNNTSSLSMSPVNFRSNATTIGGDVLYSHASNFRGPYVNSFISSSLTRSANLQNVHSNSNKRLENIADGASGACESVFASSLAVSSASDSRNQHKSPPTSFANLIKGFRNGNSIEINAANNVIPPHAVACKSNKTLTFKPTETFIVDHSSNSNSEICLTTAIGKLETENASSPATIVIDIQDSNSGSNAILKTTEAPLTNVSASVVASSPFTAVAASSVSFFKTKKSKKDKKRKEKLSDTIITPHRSNPSTSAVVINEGFSSNQQHRHITTDNKFTHAIEDNKSHLTFPVSNISDILSLSNSSMSSLFPGDAGGLAIKPDEQNKIVAGPSFQNKQSTNLSDLTFTGKFKQSSSSLSQPLLNLMDIAESGNCNTQDSSQRTSPKNSKVLVLSGQKNSMLQNKFIPFSGSGCNSNNSTSNSRNSQFDVVDVVDHQPTEVLQEICPQKKKNFNSYNKFVAQKSSTEILSIVPKAISSPQHAVDMMDTYTSSVTTVPEKKIAKKRGRKKGSKGVDSVIAKESSLSSQMLISSLGSGGKKVKTTKELYAEMQSRKLCMASNIISTTASSPKLPNWHSQQSSQPESSCSEPSLYSPRTLDACSTNATISTVATRSTPEKYFLNIHPDEVYSESDSITSEPSRDSITLQKIKYPQRGNSMESNSNSHLPITSSKCTSKNETIVSTVAAIQKQLRDLLKQFPGIPSLRDIEAECAIGLIVCTCKIAKMQSKNEEQLESQKEINEKDVSTKYQLFKLTNSAISQKKADANNSVIPINIADDASVLQLKKKAEINIKPTEKPKRSIFDLDFDDDEDPLHTLKAEAVASIIKDEPPSNTTLESTTDIKSNLVAINQSHVKEFNLRQDKLFEKPLITTEAPPSQMMPITVSTTYEIEEDVNCLAKQHFDIQTQIITQFHINALHNCYIANVNGNWDDADTTNCSVLTDTVIDMTTTFSSPNANGYNVVPKYGSHINEHIRKDLSNFTFTNKCQLKKRLANIENIDNIPFLGVARYRQIQNEKTEPRTDQIDSITNNKEECIQKESQKSQNFSEIAKDETSTKNSLLTNVLVLTNTKIKNNELLKDITIDIDDMSCTAIMSKEAKCQNLLTVANNLNDDSSIEPSETSKNYSKNIDEIVNSISTTDIMSTNELFNLKKPTKSSLNLNDISVLNYSASANDNISSGHSSTYSNSSLKQTQDFINLKLRQQRLQNQEEQNSVKLSTSKRKRSKNKKVTTCRKSLSNSEENSFNDINKKPRLIKRIKIAINGDVATQRQLFSGSSDDEDKDGVTDDLEGQTNNNDEEDANNSIGTRRYSTVGEDNLCNLGKSYMNNDEIGIIKPDLEDDEDYGNFDEEYDDGEEENYTGDYHEVVTRDISTPSTGNNHIVLTIKKTPSKTSSPSNSLSIMSPVSSSSIFNHIACSSNDAVLKKVAVNVSTGVNDDFNKQQQLITSENSNTENGLQKCEADLNISASNKSNNRLDCTEDDMVTLFNVTKFSASQPVAATNMQKTKCFKRLRKRKYQAFKSYRISINENSEIMKPIHTKLHRQLFFSNEICIRENSGAIIDKVLNISSCSSSCSGDESDEYKTSLREENKTRGSTHNSRNNSPIQQLTCTAKQLTDILLIESQSNAEVNKKELQKEKYSEGKKNSYFRIPKNCPLNDTMTYNSTERLNEQSEYSNLPVENNGLLLSFNNIYYTLEKENANENIGKLTQPEGNIDYEWLKQQFQKKNCDDYNNLYNNNNNFNLIKYNSNESILEYNNSSRNSCKEQQQCHDIGNSRTSVKITNNNMLDTNLCTASSSSKLIPHKEYRSGLRSVDEDVDDDEGNNCARIQQFKEWHQVLQLRSYNEELLTVLPYVVLE